MQTEALVELQLGLVIRKVGAWEGPSGSIRSNVTLSEPAPIIQRYTMNWSLVIGWGLTVAAEFDKVVVPQPQGMMALLLWVQDFANWVWPLIRLTMLVLAPPEADISPEDQAVLATLA